MEKVYSNCCGIDVHKKLMVACFVRGNKKEIREFGATTSDLLSLAQWLVDGNCEIVAMESTASYWKPLFNILESTDLKAIIVNAKHMKAVPGRKTDVKDSEWIADLLQHGLLKASYIPNRDQRELRELISYRKSLIADRTRELNRLQKMLEGANIKLSGSISDINGMSSRAILSELLKGKTLTSKDLEQMKQDKKIHHQLKTDFDQLAKDVHGFITPVQNRMMSELLKHVDELTAHINSLDNDIDNHMKEDEKQAAAMINEVTGIGSDSARAIISVIGTDMSRFPSDGHLSAWAGLCAGNNESAKKKRTARTRKGNMLLKTTLIICAHSAVKCKSSYFYAQYQRISQRRGSKKAYVAVAHSMIIAIYHILKDGVKFSDLGAEYYNRFNKERKINSYLKKLKALGWPPEATPAG